MSFFGFLYFRDNLTNLKRLLLIILLINGNSPSHHFILLPHRLFLLLLKLPPIHPLLKDHLQITHPHLITVGQHNPTNIVIRLIIHQIKQRDLIRRESRYRPRQVPLRIVLLRRRLEYLIFTLIIY